MAFAANCGFKKLLVFSGVTKPQVVENWTLPEEYKPDYYATSLGTVLDIIKSNL